MLKWVVTSTLCALALAGRATPAQTPQAGACAGPAYHQFDFWIGDWDVFDAGGTARVAHVRVTSLLDGCLLREEYEDDKGLKGQSVSSYEAAAGSWQQTWITNRADLLVIHGTLQGTTMVFSGSSKTSTGNTRVRATWKPAGADVHETAERSTDGGKTWQPWFDLIFKPHH
jgi:hypothetical protein